MRVEYVRGVLLSHEVSSPSEFPMSCRLLVRSIINIHFYSKINYFAPPYFCLKLTSLHQSSFRKICNWNWRSVKKSHSNWTKKEHSHISISICLYIFPLFVDACCRQYVMNKKVYVGVMHRCRQCYHALLLEITLRIQS